MAPCETVVSGKTIRMRAGSAIYFGHLAQITVDSFFNYLYHPTQLARFHTNGKVEAREMDSPEKRSPFPLS